MNWRAKIILGLLFWIMVAPPAQADNAKMTHIVFRIVDPQVPEGSFALVPREMWRLGTRYLRLEEAPDPGRGIHALIIVDQPHTFMINRYSNQGMHILDPGPTYNVHMPLFPFPNSSEISKLEFGGEWEFFAQRNARQMPNVNAGGSRYTTYMLEIDGAILVLFADETSGQPVQLALQSGNASYVIRYDTYEAGLEPDMNLFKIPAGVKISEAEN